MKKLVSLTLVITIFLALLGIDSCKDIDIPLPGPTNTPEPSVTAVPTQSITPTVTQEPTQIPTPVPTVTPVEPFTCVDIEDGPGNRLWKPVSDSTFPHKNGFPVVLLPNKYCFQNLYILNVIGAGVIPKDKYHCDGGNDNRGHWYISKKAKDLPTNIEILMDNGDCFKINGVQSRHD